MVFQEVIAFGGIPGARRVDEREKFPPIVDVRSGPKYPDISYPYPFLFLKERQTNIGREERVPPIPGQLPRQPGP